MNEITIDDQIYVSSKRAAEITGYAKDYVGQLCREGRIEARLIGRNWYVRESALRDHRFGEEKGESPIKVVSSVKDPELVVESNYIKVEEPEVLPILHRESHANAHSPLPVEEMQQAWKDWFNQQRESELPEPVAVKKIEQPIETEETEVVIEPEVIQEAQISTYTEPNKEDRHIDIIIQKIVPAPKLSQIEHSRESTSNKIPKKTFGLLKLSASLIGVLVIIATLLNLGVLTLPHGYLGANTANAISGTTVYRK